jgi:transcriptional regulator with PAS, ATPase and Fis domain
LALQGIERVCILAGVMIRDGIVGPRKRQGTARAPARASDTSDRELELVACWQDGIHCYPLPKQGEVTLGRAEDSHVRLDYPGVSRHHAVLHLGAQLVIEDLGGTNGTMVRDTRSARADDQTLSLRQLVRESAEIQVGDGIGLGALTLVVRRRADALANADAAESDAFPVVHGAALRTVYDQARRAAQANIPVLILGETGVGKELLARAIHTSSPRANHPFLAINCAALSEGTLEGELFGYEKGAFTGAIQARPGLFEAATGGSVFLDELGELPLSTQAKLLRVLEERAVLRLGARSVRKIDVRFVAATNRDLSRDVELGRFRQDLFFRLNGLSVTVPPLRERGDEIEPLTRAFVAHASRQLERPPVSLPEEVLDLLRRYSWPGNVRELRNVVERAVVLCNQNKLTVADLPSNLVSETRPSLPVARADVVTARPSADRPPIDRSRVHYMRDDLKALERSRILSALDDCSGNQTRAARLLGISRGTLVTRLAGYDVPRPRKTRAE